MYGQKCIQLKLRGGIIIDCVSLLNLVSDRLAKFALKFLIVIYIYIYIFCVLESERALIRRIARGQD